jgi:hypothetical protein
MEKYHDGTPKEVMEKGGPNTNFWERFIYLDKPEVNI